MFPTITLDAPKSARKSMRKSPFLIYEEKVGGEFASPGFFQLAQDQSTHQSTQKAPKKNIANKSLTPRGLDSNRSPFRELNRLSPSPLRKSFLENVQHKDGSPKCLNVSGKSLTPLCRRLFEKRLSPVSRRVSIDEREENESRQFFPASQSRSGRRDKEILDEAFIESVVDGDPNFSTPKNIERNKDVGVVTSSPRVLPRHSLSAELASASFSKAIVNTSLPSFESGSGNGSGTAAGSSNGSGSGVQASSGDHLLGVLDSVVDLSPVPHYGPLAGSISETDSPSLSPTGISYFDINTPASTSSIGSPQSSSFSKTVRRTSRVSISSKDYLVLTGNVEETSVVTLLFDAKPEESRMVRVIRSDGISLKAVQQCDIVVTDLLGSGGFGKVFLGKWFDMELAIKIMSGKLIKSKNSDSSGSNWQDSYTSEKKILNLKHRNIVRTLAMSLRHTYPEEPVYVFMEYAGDRNLRNVLETSEKRFGSKRLTRYIRQIASGLYYVHSHGIIHMDVKPANIIITSQDVLKIGDFGCCISARRAPRTTAPDHFKGQLSLHVPGTPAYTAPELFCGLQATRKCDMYSLAICLWQLFTRSLEPYPTLKQPHALIYCVVRFNRRPVWDEERVGDLDGSPDFRREYIAMTERNWNKNPEVRQSMKELLEFAKRWRKS